jgi:hypothetical protein
MERRTSAEVAVPLGWRRRTLAQFRHQRHVFQVDLAVRAPTTAAAAVAAAIPTVGGNVSHAAADVALDGVGDDGLVLALPRPVVVRSAVRAPVIIGATY